MSQIVVNNLSMHYGSKLLFDEANLKLSSGHRYGIVGANGSGKSTFLRLLTQEETPSLGEIQYPRDVVIGWLKQDQFRYENDLIIEVVLQGKPTLWSALKEKETLLAETDFDEQAGFRLAELEEIIAHEGGYTAEPFAESLLIGLGIRESDIYEPLSALSGGFKLRVLLAQTLFQNPEILLLDEPTNHLDIMTIAWLENYLKTEFKGLLAFISHDIRFIQNLASDILDIDYGEIRHYTADYQQFTQEKALIAEQKLQEKRSADEQIAHLQSFVDRFRYKASKAKQAMSKLKAIERIEVPDIKRSSRQSPHFRFTIKRPSGKTVLVTHDLSKQFNEHSVLNDINLTIHRNEKIAIIGHNGVGKSTFLKLILNKIKPSKGSYEWGHETQISYFAQDHHEMLNKDITVLDWLCEQASHVTSNEVRKTLGQVLFSQDDVYKNILSLSGGEAARLLIANIMLQEGNVLLLDEPTNHLDIEAIEALETALNQYQGTLILVSHDRHFVSHIANRTIAISETGLHDFQGTYAEYLEYYGDDYLSREWLAKNNKNESQ